MYNAAPSRANQLHKKLFFKNWLDTSKLLTFQNSPSFEEISLVAQPLPSLCREYRTTVCGLTKQRDRQAVKEKQQQQHTHNNHKIHTRHYAFMPSSTVSQWQARNASIKQSQKESSPPLFKAYKSTKTVKVLLK